MSEKSVALFYYKDESQYKKFLSAYTDVSYLPATFEAWQRNIEIDIQLLEDKGFIISREYADSTDELIRYCRDRNWIIDGEARRYFATYKSRK